MSGPQWNEDDTGPTPAWPSAPPGGELAGSGGGSEQPQPEPDTRAESAPRPRGRRRLAAAAGSVAAVVVMAVVVALVVTSNSGQTPAAQAFAAAVRQSDSLTTVSAVISEKISGTNPGSISATVQAQRKPLRMSMKISVDQGGTPVGVSGIVTSRAIYLKLGAALPVPASDRGKWLKIPYSQLGAGMLAPLEQDFENENPVSEVQILRAAKDIRDVGTQTIDGVLATKYTGSFSPSAALKLLPASQRSLLAPAMNLISGNIRVAIWVAAVTSCSSPTPSARRAKS